MTSMKSAKSAEGRSIYWRTVLILAVILIAVAGAGIRVLHMMTLEDMRENLAELARSQARVLEAVAKYDAFNQSGGIEGAARSATLSQFKEGHRAFTGFRSTGEIILAERIGDEIVYLLPARKLGFRIPPPVSLRAQEAGPMEAAIQGQSGTVIDYDYQGDRVIAAHEWLPFLEVGLVAKIDLAEFNQPFYHAMLVTGLLAVIAILIGAALNARAVSPLIERIIQGAKTISEREATYRQLVDTIPGVVYRASADDQLTMRELSDPIQEIAGRPAASFLKNGGFSYLDIVLPEDRAEAQVTGTGPFSRDYRIKRPDGEIRWVADHGSISEEEGGALTRKGILLDISARKEAEHVLAELPRQLSRYISPQVYRSIFQGKQEALPGSTRKKLTVFFSDVVNFTQKSESLDPDDLTFIVNSYLNRMAELAMQHGGTLDKFIGDGVLIFFGDPESRGVGQDALACISMALEMLEEVEKLNQAALEHGINSPLEIRIGIATGYCTVGNFGSEHRMDYTVLGKTVNLAARLEASAPRQGILISSDTQLLVHRDILTEHVEPIMVKGFEKPVPIFRVLGPKR